MIERTAALPTKPTVLEDFADRFLDWVNDSRLEEKTTSQGRLGPPQPLPPEKAEHPTPCCDRPGYAAAR